MFSKPICTNSVYVCSLRSDLNLEALFFQCSPDRNGVIRAIRYKKMTKGSWPKRSKGMESFIEIYAETEDGDYTYSVSGKKIIVRGVPFKQDNQLGNAENIISHIIAEIDNIREEWNSLTTMDIDMAYYGHKTNAIIAKNIATSGKTREEYMKDFDIMCRKSISEGKIVIKDIKLASSFYNSKLLFDGSFLVLANKLRENENINIAYHNCIKPDIIIRYKLVEPYNLRIIIHPKKNITIHTSLFYGDLHEALKDIFVPCCDLNAIYLMTMNVMSVLYKNRYEDAIF